MASGRYLMFLATTKIAKPPLASHGDVRHITGEGGAGVSSQCEHKAPPFSAVWPHPPAASKESMDPKVCDFVSDGIV